MSKEIKLTSGKVALVSDEDFDAISKHKWLARKNRHAYYAFSRIRGKTVLMHRLILGAKNGDYVDHVDGDGLNNTRQNIRICTNKDNVRNQAGHKRVEPKSSRYKGVFICCHTGRWMAKIVVDRRQIYLGRYTSENNAAEAYNKAASEHFGKFARLNIILPEDRDASCEPTPVNCASKLAKMKKEIVEGVVQDAVAGMSRAGIAKKRGISFSTVDRIIRTRLGGDADGK